MSMEPDAQLQAIRSRRERLYKRLDSNRRVVDAVFESLSRDERAIANAAQLEGLRAEQTMLIKDYQDVEDRVITYRLAHVRRQSDHPTNPSERPAMQLDGVEES